MTSSFPFVRDLNIKQGSDFDISFLWRETVGGNPVDLTDYAATLIIKRHKGDTTILAMLTSEEGGLVLGGEAGTIIITILASLGLSSDCRYELTLTGPKTLCFAEGQILVDPKL